MAAVTFHRNASSAYADCFAEREWALPATGEVGQATIRLPYSATAASKTYIDPAGGSWLEIANEGGCGKWLGIIREIQFGETELQITAAQPHVMLGDRVLMWETTFRHASPAGYIVGRILREVLPGMPFLWSRYTPSDGSDGIVNDYQFSGQDAWAAILDLMELSQSELFIDTETGEITWEGALAGDRRVTTPLIAGGNLRNWSYRASGEQRAAEVIVKRGSERFPLSSGTSAAAYPGQVTITAEAGESLYVAAAAELERRSGAAITVSGSVDSTLFSIREGDFPRVLFPRGEFTGKEHPCRVLARAKSDDSSLMDLGLQVIDESVGVRVAPPMRGGSAKTSGAKGRGSWRQRERARSRAVWLAWLRDH